MTQTHLHIFFTDWRHESRAWRAGEAAQDAGYADRVIYVGHKVNGLPDRETRRDGQVIWRIGPHPSKPGTAKLIRALALPRWWSAGLRELALGDVTQITAHGLAALPLGIGLRKKLGGALIYDAHELESERESWPLAVRKIARAVERRCMRFVDHLLVVSEAIGAWYEETYGLSKVTVLRNVPVLQATPQPAALDLRDRFEIPHSATIYIYCGALGTGRGLFQKMEAFRVLGPDVHLVFMGYGTDEAELRTQSAKLPNVHVHAAVPQEQLIETLKAADVGIWVPDGTSLSYHYALPNKLFEYSLAGLALLLGEGPELKRYGTTYPAARFTTSDPKAIAQAIINWTPDEIAAARAQAKTHDTPHWDTEKTRLFETYDSLGLRRFSATDPA